MKIFAKLCAFVVAVTAVSFAASGCATPDVGHMAGSIMFEYGQEGRVVAHDGKVSSAKTGKATQESLLGWIGSGDSSIEAARNNAEGGINRISHMDYHASHLLGLIGDCTTIVYGD